MAAVQQKQLANVLARLPVRGRRILDIGCADGRLSLVSKEALGAEEIYGLDVSTECLQEAGKRGVKTFKVDVSRDKFPLETGSFDVVIASEILEHCILPANLLKEAYRVLRPGGYLVLSTPNLASFYDRILLLFGSQPLSLEASYEYPSAGKAFRNAFKPRGGQRRSFEGDPGHIRCMSYRATKELLKHYQFGVKNVTAYNWPHSFVKAPFRVLTLALDGFFSLLPGLAVGYIYTAIKEETQ
ncbi:MAG: class I SAM-dependent methyltransferase [Dehalococcoidia bacterium]